MTLSVESRIDRGHVRFDVTGAWNLADIFALIGRAREEADAASLDCVLARLDDGKPSPSPRRLAADPAALRTSLSPSPLRGTRFGENAAVNRGARMAVLSSEEHALAWLDGPG